MPPRAATFSSSRRLHDLNDSDSSDEYLGSFEPGLVHPTLSSDSPIHFTSATITRRVVEDGAPYYSVVLNPVERHPSIDDASGKPSDETRINDNRRRISEPLLLEHISLDDIFDYASPKELERFENSQWAESFEAARIVAVAERAEEYEESMRKRRIKRENQQRMAMSQRGRPTRGRGRGRGRRGRSRGYGGGRWAAGNTRESLILGASAGMDEDAEDTDMLDAHDALDALESIEEAANVPGMTPRTFDFPYTNGRGQLPDDELSESDADAAAQLIWEFQVSQTRPPAGKRHPSPEVVIYSPRKVQTFKTFPGNDQVSQAAATPIPAIPESPASTSSSLPELFVNSTRNNGGPSIIDYIDDSEPEANTQAPRDTVDVDDSDSDIEILQVRKTPQPLALAGKGKARIQPVDRRGSQSVAAPTPPPRRPKTPVLSQPVIERIIEHLEDDGEMAYCVKFVDVPENEDIRWIPGHKLKQEHPDLVAAYKMDYEERTGKALLDEDDYDDEEESE